MRWLWVALLVAGCESASSPSSVPPPAPPPSVPKAPPAVKLRRRSLVWPAPPAPIDPPSPGFSGLVQVDGESPATRVFEDGVLVAEVESEEVFDELTDATPDTLYLGTVLSVWGATPGQLVHALGLSEGGPYAADYANDPMSADETSQAYVGPAAAGAPGEVLVVFGNPGCGDGGKEGEAARSLLEALSARFGRCAIASCSKYAVYYWGCAENGKIERFVATGATDDTRAWWFEGDERPDEESARLRQGGKYDASWPDPALKWLQQWRVAQGAPASEHDTIQLPGPGIAGYVNLRWASEG
jgi:hypothetical protein